MNPLIKVKKIPVYAGIGTARKLVGFYSDVDFPPDHDGVWKVQLKERPAMVYSECLEVPADKAILDFVTLRKCTSSKRGEPFHWQLIAGDTAKFHHQLQKEIGNA